MANINLLPWREEKRKEMLQEFLAVMFACVVVVVLVIGGIHIFIGNLIDYQQGRNTFLTSEIAKLDKQLKQIATLESTKEKLLSRMEVIQSLQQRRPQIVHLFDELVRTVPEGIYLNKLKQKGKQLTIEGIAESNGRVSAYMRNIDASDWMTTPKLKVIKTKKGSFRNSEFTLITQQSQPKSSTGEES